MKPGRFIVRILRETDQDSVAVVAKRHRVSDATIYIWRKKFGQLDTDEVKRIKALETENARLKKLLVDRDLEIEVMKEINVKNVERTGSAGTGSPSSVAWTKPAAGVCADKASALGAPPLNLPLFDVPLSHSIMRPSIAVPRASVLQIAWG
jgi:putative transposase